MRFYRSWSTPCLSLVLSRQPAPPLNINITRYHSISLKIAPCLEFSTRISKEVTDGKIQQKLRIFALLSRPKYCIHGQITWNWTFPFFNCCPSTKGKFSHLQGGMCPILWKGYPNISDILDGQISRNHNWILHLYLSCTSQTRLYRIKWSSSSEGPLELHSVTCLIFQFWKLW